MTHNEHLARAARRGGLITYVHRCLIGIQQEMPETMYPVAFGLVGDDIQYASGDVEVAHFGWVGCGFAPNYIVTERLTKEATVREVRALATQIVDEILRRERAGV